MDKSDNLTRYASFYQRLLAHNIDLIPVLILFYLTTLLPQTAFDLYLTGFIYTLYNIAFELSPMRATPGKKYVRLQVTSISSEFLPLKIILRNCLKPLSLLLFFMGFLFIQLSRKKQALHDYIAGTIVLFKEE